LGKLEYVKLSSNGSLSDENYEIIDDNINYEASIQWILNTFDDFDSFEVVLEPLMNALEYKWYAMTWSGEPNVLTEWMTANERTENYNPSLYELFCMEQTGRKRGE
jgi:hypothetical protein